MDTKKLRQKILDLAIHGKLVPQDPNDEPASVLLERIREEKERMIAEGKIKRSKKSTTSDTSHYENVPFEVPEGWEWVSLSEIAHSCLGKMLDKEKNKGTFLPYLRNVNVRWGAFELEDVLQMPFSEEEDERFSIIHGDLVVCEGGEPGRCAIWENTESIKFQKALHRVRCFNGALNYYIKTVIEWYASSKNIENYYTGSTIKHLTGESLNTLQIPLPPIQEQHRIVSIIDQWTSLISLLDTESTELKQNIEKAKSKILDLAIHGKLVPQDANDEPASELLKRINPKAIASCDNPHYEQVPFEIPANWAWIRIDEINKFKSKTVNPLSYPTSQFELYSVPRFETGEPEFPYGKDVASSKVEVEEGDVLLCKINPHLNRVWVVRRIMAQLNSLASSEWIVIRTDEIMPEYLALTMQSPYFRELMMSNVSGVGGSLMRAQPTFVKQYMIPIPPIREQERIIEKVAQFNLYIDTIASTLP